MIKVNFDVFGDECKVNFFINIIIKERKLCLIRGEESILLVKW